VGSADSILSRCQQDPLLLFLSSEAYVLVTCRKIVETTTSRVLKYILKFYTLLVILHSGKT